MLTRRGMFVGRAICAMCRLELRKLAIAGFIFIGAIIGTASSYAATLVGAPLEVTGIDGLVVGADTYNVTFLCGPSSYCESGQNSYNSSYTTPPTFFGNSAGAEAAADALAAALEAIQGPFPNGPLNILGMPGPNGDNNFANLLLVPVSFLVPPDNPDIVIGYAAAQQELTEPGGSWAPQQFDASKDDTEYGLYTSFTLVATPLPDTLPLLATGLGALGLFGWRRKRKAQAAAV